MRLFPLLFLLVAFAGCIDDEPNADEADIDSFNAALAAFGSTETRSNLTQFHWAEWNAVGDIAMRFTFDFGGDNECFRSITQSSDSDHSKSRMYVVESQGTRSSGGGGSFNTVYVHAGGQDVLPRNEGGGGAGWGGGTSVYSGTTTITLITPGAEPADWIDPPLPAMAIDIVCAQPFQFVGADAGDTAYTFSEDTLKGTIVAGQWLVTDAQIGAGTSWTVSDSEGHIILNSWGQSVGQGQLHSPDDAMDIDMAESGIRGLSGGPGTYSIEVDRLGLTEPVWMGAIYGIEGAVDITAGLQADAIADKP